MINTPTPANPAPLNHYQCSVCNSEAETSPWVWTSCQPAKHIFHKNCIVSQLSQQKLKDRYCPSCLNKTVVPLTNKEGSIIKVGLDVEWPNDLLDAIRNGELETVEQLLKNGADANLEGFKWAKPFVHGVNSYLRSSPAYTRQKVLLTPPPLFYAVSMNKTEIVKVLLDHGALVNDPANPADQVSPVFFATQNGFTQTLSLLLEHNGDANSTYRSLSALYTAIASDNKESARILIKYGADLNAPNPSGHCSCFQLMMQKNGWSDVIIEILSNPELKNRLSLLDIASGVAIPVIKDGAAPCIARTQYIKMYLSLLTDSELSEVLTGKFNKKKLIDYAREQGDSDITKLLSSKLKYLECSGCQDSH